MKCLQNKFPDESKVIESICILGSPPEPVEQDEINQRWLKEIGARYITYDTLVKQTVESYAEYLEKERIVSDLTTLMERLDEEFV